MRFPNLELFRIVTMMGIVFHHALVHSLLGPVMYTNPWSLKSALLLWMGAWGKTGINCFVLLTGYFMCEKRLTIKRMAKLIGLTEFYAFLVYGMKVLAGGASWSGVRETVCTFISGVGGSFVPSFIVLMLLVPMLNWLLHKMTSRFHLFVACVALFVFSVLPSVGVKVNLGEVVWFVALYVVAAYVRREPLRFSWNSRRMALLVGGVFVLAVCSMVFGAWLTARMPGRMMIYYWVFPDQKILAFLCAFTAFLFFRALDTTRWPQGICRCINGVAATTFGIYLLHDGVLGDDGKAWLWGRVDSSSSVASYVEFALLIFVICMCVDFLRGLVRRIVCDFVTHKMRFGERRINA